jgi:hypothetical protein
MPCKRRVEGHFKNSGEKRQHPEGNIHEIMSDFSRPTIFLNNFSAKISELSMPACQDNTKIKKFSGFEGVEATQ